jgi:hypothetical protein
VPARLPANIISGIIEPARALLMLRIQTFLKPAAEIIDMEKFLINRLSQPYYFANSRILDYFYITGAVIAVFGSALKINRFVTRLVVPGRDQDSDKDTKRD